MSVEAMADVEPPDMLEPLAAEPGILESPVVEATVTVETALEVDLPATGESTVLQAVEVSTEARASEAESEAPTFPSAASRGSRSGTSGRSSAARRSGSWHHRHSAQAESQESWWPMHRAPSNRPRRHSSVPPPKRDVYRVAPQGYCWREKRDPSTRVEVSEEKSLEVDPQRWSNRSYSRWWLQAPSRNAQQWSSPGWTSPWTDSWLQSSFELQADWWTQAGGWSAAVSQKCGPSTVQRAGARASSQRRRWQSPVRTAASTWTAAATEMSHRGYSSTAPQLAKPPAALLPMTLEELLGSTHAGTVCDIDTARQLGFIRNRRIHDFTGRDVRFRVGQAGGFRAEAAVGDVVTFEVEMDAEGRPWVRIRTAAGVAQAHAWTGARATADAGRSTSGSRPLTVERLLKEEHVGVVSEYLEEAGYGFIKNTAIHRLCGRDVRFQAWQLLGLRVGDTVCFRARLSSDGLPRVAGPAAGASNTTCFQ